MPRATQVSVYVKDDIQHLAVNTHGMLPWTNNRHCYIAGVFPATARLFIG